MAGPERHVRQLRLRAREASDVRHVLPVLEDALRCASLPDGGGRLLLVRQLALGRLRRDVNAQALSQVIEQRVSRLQVEGGWVAGGSAAAATATQVCFDGALQARTALALNLVRGQACAEWYWPLAVPEWRDAQGPADALRRIAQHIASWPEARSALPAWVGTLLQAGAAPQLATAIGEAEGQALMQRAGLPLEAPLRHRFEAVGDADGGLPAPAQRLHADGGSPRPAEPRSPGAPRWLLRLMPAAPAPRAAPESPPRPQTEVAGLRPVPDNSRSATPSQRAERGLLLRQPERARPAADAPLPQQSTLHPDAADAPVPTHRTPTGPRRDNAPQRPVTPESEPSGAAAARADFPSVHRPIDAPTTCAGLLFLLPVLARLGLADWLGPQADGAFARRVLRAALLRLQAPADDAIWSLVHGPADAETPAQPKPAPGRWADPLLMAPGGRPTPVSALAACTTADQQAAVWLDLARRWLRRAGRIGLASLVRRPGRLSLTATHADLVFDLNSTDIRVRRLGLDVDPGWLPWFGRVVGFHYERPAL